jgi:hypothetical protein
MKRREFEEILDECISAYLSGSRSVEESLSLYPSIARELEPLLRAAADTADTFQEYRPSPQAQERIRLKILQAANERAAARALTRQIEGFSSEPKRRSAWWFAVPLTAGASVAAVAAALFFTGQSSDEPDRAALTVVERPEFSSRLDDARRQLEALQFKAASGRNVTAADIDALVGATRRLAEEEPAPLAAAEQEEVEELLGEQVELLAELNEESAVASKDIEDAIEETVSTASALGVPVPTPDVEPVATASASPSPTPVVDGTPAPATPQSTPSPSPFPAPGNTTGN